MPNAHSWTAASSAIPCPYCSCLASRTHQLKCLKRPMQCGLCHSKSLTAASMAAHASNECPMRRAPCPGCGEQVLTDALQDHIMGGACRARTYTCRTCEEVFWIGEEYLRHALPRCARSVVACQLCGQTVSTLVLAEHYQQCALAALSKDRLLGRPLTSPNSSPPLPSPQDQQLRHHADSAPQDHQQHTDTAVYSLTPLRSSSDVMLITAGAGARNGSRSPLRVSPALLRSALQHSSSPARAIIPLSRSPKRNLVHVEARTSPRSTSSRGRHHSDDCQPQPTGGQSPPLRMGYVEGNSTPTMRSSSARSMQSSPTPRRLSGGAHPNDGPQDPAMHHNGQLSDTLENRPPTPPSSNVTREGSATPTRGGMQRTVSPGGSTYQTRSSLLRVNASHVRLCGGATSLAAKDERQQLLSDQIRKREHELHAAHLQSRSPVLPACVTQPLGIRSLRR
jgi:hypothetical protein